MSLRRKNITENAPVNPEEFELGFGSKFIGGQSRIINENGDFNILRRGIEKSTFYEHMIGLSWPLFILELFAFYIVINAVFASIYCLLGPNVMHGINETDLIQKFQDAFFFSIHTFTTVGYGNVYPIGFFANFVVIIDAFTGLLMVAIATGLLFVRFSKAKVNIKQSQHMVLAPYKEGKSLQFRIVNASNTPLLNVEASVTATWLEKHDQIFRRKFQRLKLELEHVYMLPLNWTIVHPIEEESPLHHKSKQALNREMMEFIVMIKAFEPQYNQNIFKNFSYSCSSIVEDAKFKLMYYSTDELTILDINELDSIEKI